MSSAPLIWKLPCGTFWGIQHKVHLGKDPVAQMG